MCRTHTDTSLAGLGQISESHANCLLLIVDMKNMHSTDDETGKKNRTPLLLAYNPPKEIKFSCKCEDVDRSMLLEEIYLVCTYLVCKLLLCKINFVEQGDYLIAARRCLLDSCDVYIQSSTHLRDDLNIFHIVNRI